MISISDIYGNFQGNYYNLTVNSMAGNFFMIPYHSEVQRLIKLNMADFERTPGKKWRNDS